MVADTNRVNLAALRKDKGDAYDTHTLYKLHPSAAYHVLDTSVASSEIKAISDEHIHACSNALLEVKKNDFIVGTLSAPWASADAAKIWASSTEHISKIAKLDRDLLAMSRRVLSVTSIDAQCVSIKTVTMNPLLMFDSFRVESMFSKGSEEADTKRKAKQAKTAARRRLQSGMTNGSGLGPLPCTNQIWQVGSGYFAGSWDYTASNQGSGNDDYIIDLDLTMGCAQMQKTVTAFNFNGNSNNPPDGPADDSLDLTSGVTCTNCWAYLGATMYVLAEYTMSTFSGLTVRMEAKASGEAAAEIDLQVSNPTWSGSQSGNLIGADSSYSSIPINAYMTFYYKIGGMDYTMTGSGSAQGSASLVGGFDANAGITATYDETNSFQASVTYGVGTTPASFSESFTSASFDATVALTFTENSYIQVGWGSTISVNANVNEILQGVATLQMGASLSMTAQVSATNPITTERILTEGKVFVPGDKIELTYTYQDHTPNETITLFVSIVPQSGVETAIFQKDFRTTVTGAGVLAATWTVPWDERFAGSDAGNTHFVFRTSQRISKSFPSDPVTLQMFTGTDGGVTINQQATTVSKTAPLSIEWNEKLFSHFVTQFAHPHIGAQQAVEHVTVDFIGETMNADGTVAYTVRYPTNQIIPNFGHAVVAIPDVIQSGSVSGHRFWVQVSSASHPTVTTWSAGTFQFAPTVDALGLPHVTPAQAAIAFAQISPATKHLEVQRRNTKQTLYKYQINPVTGAITDLPVEEPAAGSRQLQSASMTLTTKLNAGVQVTSISSFLGSMPVMSAPVIYNVFSVTGTESSGVSAPAPFVHTPLDPTSPLTVVGTIAPPRLQTPPVLTAVPPIPPPTGPALQGWYIGSLYSDSTCSGSVLYSYARAFGRCEMLDNEHHTLSVYVLNTAVTPNTASVEVFYYTDSSCTTLLSTNPLSWRPESLGQVNGCVQLGNTVHYIKHDWDATHATPPVFSIQGPSQVSYNSNVDCGILSKVQSFTVYAANTCYLTLEPTTTTSHISTCATQSAHPVSAAVATSTALQMYSDPACATSAQTTITPFMSCADVDPKTAVVDGPVIYNFGSFKSEYCGNTLQAGPMYVPPAAPVKAKAKATGMTASVKAGIIGGSLGAFVLLIAGFVMYKRTTDKKAIAAATAADAATGGKNIEINPVQINVATESINPIQANIVAESI